MGEVAQTAAYEEVDNTALERIQNGDMFVSGINFTENGFEISYMEKAKQTGRIMTAQSLYIIADTSDSQDAYVELQELCQIIVRDAFVEIRNQ